VEVEGGECCGDAGACVLFIFDLLSRVAGLLTIINYINYLQEWLRAGFSFPVFFPDPL